MRFDSSSIGVMAMAVVCALGAAWGADRFSDSGRAEAAVLPVVVEAPAPIQSTAAKGPAQLRKSADGHYWADALIDGRAVRVMVDTGASVVVLTRNDALRLGLRLTPEDFSGTVVTASGHVRAAPVQLSAVAVGAARVEQVEALVVEEGLEHSLLGMSYLGRLSTFTATPTALTLTV
jgi:aspartyl protease family protein